MKKLVATIVVLTIVVVLFSLFRARSVDQYWYGYCKIGDNDRMLAFISAGQHVYVDHNSDGVPQKHELIPESGSIEVVSTDGESIFKLYNVSTALAPESVSEERPQLIDLYIQSNEFPDLWQIGTIATAREPKNAGTCHLLGPLSIMLMPPDIELTPGKVNELKITIGTIQNGAFPISSVAGPSAALVFTSVPGDRTRYAFHESLRPKMQLSFDQSEKPETVIFDEFC